MNKPGQIQSAYIVAVSCNVFLFFMKSSFRKIIFRLLKITGISLFSIIALLFLLPYLFPATVTNEIKKLVNNSLKGELNFTKARLSFFNHFPSLTLTLYDFSLKGAAPFEKDTLLACRELSFGVDLSTVFKSKLKIDQIFLTRALINIQVDTQGRANYNVYVSEKEQEQSPKEPSNTSLRIKQIIIEDSRVVYHDRSLPMFFEAKGFNYKGKGRLNDAVFDLKTYAEISSFDFVYNNTPYVISKKVNADLVTHINTNSLELLFSKNNLVINQLPVQFTGRFAFLKNGYDMAFKIDSKTTGLYNMITALPPAYLHWLDNTELNGSASVYAELSGQYIPATNTMPGFKMNMSIRDGSVAYNKAPNPATNLFFDFRLRFPGFNTDSLQINVDSLSFNIGKEYLNAVVHTVGLDKPTIHAKINTEMNLEQFDQAFGIKPFDAKGNYTLHLTADGTYAARSITNARNKQETVIDQIPRFTVTSTIDNGYFKLASLPQGISNISFQLNASCPDSNYRHAHLDIQNFNARVLSNFVQGFIKLNTIEDLTIDAGLRTKFHLSDIQKVYPLDSLQIAGDADIDLKAKGKYNAARKIFPVMNATIKMDNGLLQTAYYPRPIDQINIDATITNTNGTPAATKIFIRPISFRFEDQPFMLTAGLQNFNNITYNISSKGRIDLGRIYKVFSYDGLDVKGYLETDLKLKGSQQDVMAKHYDRLFNAGSIKVRDMVVISKYFPKPFLISDGTFRFKQDKVWFEQFHATYGKSDFALNGYLTNVIGYALQDNQVLAGALNLTGNKLVVDEFMAQTDGTQAVNTTTETTANTSTGVVMIPENLDILFTANIKKVDYNTLILADTRGEMRFKKGTLSLKETGFTLINAPVVMDATYKNLSATQAVFDYHIKATDFDINKAYREIKLFHDMATSAAGVQGIVSLDYALKGRLNKAMMPVYPSLSGGGVLNVKKVQLKGFRLMNALSSSTGREQIKDKEVSGIDIKSKIARNIMTIERVKLKIAGFRPRFEGQVSLDGRMNLTGRLGLPPWGILGIPFTVTGTQANPKIHLRRSKDGDKLEETEDASEADSAEMKFIGPVQ